ncbi:hypothetical protein CRI93_09530 [Longimonas halophila]|uniref:Glycosyl transferase family 1 n=1 Tax=Longimonas halophila TaxID=1469170 RepID=A0A2H3NNE2_9BACT|nr:glycosyltransferase [Longimonas halophila]PEN06513.1 hypothetical protein CRI93_09530 [Longimonas halophila]
MTVAHTVASLDPDAGGPSRTVSALCEALGEHSTSVELVTTDAGGKGQAMTPSAEAAQTTFVPSHPLWTRVRQFYTATRARIHQTGAELVHDHGVWLLTNAASYYAAQAQGVPYVLTPRGMLEPWALNHNAWKKNLVWYAYQHRILKGAALLHATAPAEATHLRALGLDAPIVVAPNGVTVPQQWKQKSDSGTMRQALFLSRVHPKKGLLNLMEAWAAVDPPDWELVIAGPDENDHQSEVEARAVELGITDQVSFPGSIPDAEKWALYRASDLFVLPTFSENFGVVVAEALASGIPAITTTGAPWSVLEERDCGWWIETGVDPLVEALREATTCSDAERLAMGRYGRELVKERFAWPAIAQTLAGAYRWLLDPTVGRPESVVPRGAAVDTKDLTGL